MSEDIVRGAFVLVFGCLQVIVNVPLFAQGRVLELAFVVFSMFSIS